MRRDWWTVDTSMRNQNSQATIASRQERAASRILDDESLRDSLTDDEFQPILDWALAVTDRVAASTTDLTDDAADKTIEAGIQVIREVTFMVQETLAVHAERDAKDRRNSLEMIGSLLARDNPSGLEKSALGTVRRRLTALADHLDAEPDLPGAEVAAQIAAVLSSADAS